MTEFLRSATDRHTREETVSRISELAERYAPNTQWFIDTMNAVFAIGGDVSSPLLPITSCGSPEKGAEKMQPMTRSEDPPWLRADLLSSTPKLPKVLRGDFLGGGGVRHIEWQSAVV